MSIWRVNLRYDAAPPPELRPPMSRNAVHDPSQLVYQIPAILGSYVLVVCMIGAFILAVGRRLRKEAQEGKPISVEMVKPRTLDSSPASPPTSIWSKWETPKLPFDEAVIANDRQRQQEEMERIYAHVLAEETKIPNYSRPTHSRTSTAVSQPYVARPPTPFEDSESEDEIHTDDDTDAIIHSYNRESPQRPQGSIPASPKPARSTLPFRALQPPTIHVSSPGPTKTTFLELPGGMHAMGMPNLLSAGLATPYSPYMPMSPMTPITPHLTTRQERRELQREQRHVPTQDDIVEDEREMWGDGWS